MLPFTTEVFFSVFERYNLAIWPVQLIAYGLGLLSVFLTFKPHTLGNKVISAFLAGSWIWIGVIYHMMYFSPINWGAWLFGAMFVVQGLIFFWQGVLDDRLGFRFHSDPFGWTGLCFAVFAMAVYPIIGAVAGHPWPQFSMFGVAPCPSTLFTFGMLLMAEQRVPGYLFVIPVLWSLIAGTAAWFLNIPEDWSLLLAGVLALVLVQMKNRLFSQLGESKSS